MRRLLNRIIGRPENGPESLYATKELYRHFDQSALLRDCSFTVIDTELTGLAPGRHEIVSMAAVRIREGRIMPTESFYSLVKVRRPTKRSILLHRLTPQQLESAPELADVLPEFVSFCESDLLVGHHIVMDMAFINKASNNLFGMGMSNPCLDTMRLAQVFEADMWEKYLDRDAGRVSYHLPDLAERYGLPVFTAHDALQDAMQTAYLFLFLVNKLGGFSNMSLSRLHSLGRSWRWYF